MPGYIFGIEVYESKFAMMPEQIKKHRKKRINKKWLKRYGTKQVPGMFMIAGKMCAHPDILKEFKRRGEKYANISI